MRGIREWPKGRAQVSTCGKDARIRPPGNEPRIHAERSLALVTVDRPLELLIEQDYPHSPRGRYAYGVP